MSGTNAGITKKKTKVNVGFLQTNNDHFTRVNSIDSTIHLYDTK